MPDVIPIVPEDKPAGAPKKRKSVSQKQNENRLIRLAGRAIGDFNMIVPGDKIMVCMSGGKDSYVLLDILRALQARAPIDFELLAFSVDQHLPDYPHDVLPSYFKKIGVHYRIEDQDTWSTVKRLIPEETNVCSLCSRLRRGIIYRVAREEKATKIALGHHADDIVNTLLLNMFYGGRLKAMPPILRSDDGQNTVIRPMAYIREAEIEKWVSYRDYPIIGKASCRKIENRKRQEMKALIRSWDREFPGRVHNILMSLTRVSPSHLMDKSLYDFDALPADPMREGLVKPF